MAAQSEASTSTGWVPQPHDPNDKIYAPPTNLVIGPSIDLRKLPHLLSTDFSDPQNPRYTTIYDQGELDSCTANVIATALRYGRNAKLWTDRNTGGRNVPFDPSRLYIWYFERIMMATKGETFSIKNLQKFLGDKSEKALTTEAGTKVPRDVIETLIDTNSGAYIRIGIKCVQKYGACVESTWRYTMEENDKSWTTPPPPALEEGPHYLGINFQYYRIRDLAEPGNNLIAHMEAALSEGYPVIFGFWQSGDCQIDSILGHPPFAGNGYVFEGVLKAKQAGEGGHAVVAIGYDREKQLFLIQNSMGNRFPPDANGYFWMPYRWFQPGTGMATDKDGNSIPAADDFWVVKVDSAHPADAGKSAGKPT
jgi:hypothetical protein